MIMANKPIGLASLKAINKNLRKLQNAFFDHCKKHKQTFFLSLFSQKNPSTKLLLNNF
jgi:hypothetical protein